LRAGEGRRGKLVAHAPPFAAPRARRRAGKCVVVGEQDAAVQGALTFGNHEVNLVCVGLLGARVDDAVVNPFVFYLKHEMPSVRRGCD
jgi:hypothetical protein